MKAKNGFFIAYRKKPLGASNILESRCDFYMGFPDNVVHMGSILLLFNAIFKMGFINAAKRKKVKIFSVLFHGYASWRMQRVTNYVILIYWSVSEFLWVACQTGKRLWSSDCLILNRHCRIWGAWNVFQFSTKFFSIWLQSFMKLEQIFILYTY